MKIYRAIALKNTQQINLDNIGRSWTLDEVYAEHHVKQAGCSSYIILAAEVEEDQIDVDNTLYAYDTRPREYEIVLKNVEIEAIIHFSTHENYEQWDTIAGQTGNNFFEDYLSDRSPYEGEKTMNDILELAESFV